MDAYTPAAAPEVALSFQGDALTARLSGAFTVRHGRDAERALAAVDPRRAKRLVFDVSDVREVDSAGAWLIHRTRAEAEYLGRAVELNGVGQRLAFLMKQIEAHVPPPHDSVAEPPAIVRSLENVGRNAHAIGQDAVSLLGILGVFGLRLATIFMHVRRVRGVSILSNFDRTCRGAVPIVMLMSFLIGLIVAQQGGFYLQQFGATLFVVDLAGVLILRELGVLLAAILVAGRSGSAFTAEIGSMKMREEVDALNVLGLDPVEVLVVPRLMALMIALPVLAFLSDIAALAGALIISWAYLGITPDIFLQRLQEAVTPVEFYIGIAKAPFMALIIGLVACNEGLKVGGSAESLGRQTTTAVVKSIFLVIFLDGLFAVFFGAIGI